MIFFIPKVVSSLCWFIIIVNLREMLSSLKLSSKTVIAKQEQKKLKNILQSLLASNDSIEFRHPVDWKALNLLDYCVLIKNPMDLGTIAKKCNEDQYFYVEEVLDDMQLVWDNCKLYNPPNSWIYNLAEKLERSFKKMVKNYLPHISITVPGRSPALTKQDKKPSLSPSLNEKQVKQEPSITEKQKLFQKFKILSPLGLGAVIQQIIEKHPTLFREVDEQNADLLLDNMDYSCYREVCRLVDNLSEETDRVLKRIKQ